MINKIESNLLKNLDEKGIITVKGFLDSDETKKIKDIIKYYSVPKGHHKSYFSTNFIHLALKIVKLDLVKFKHDIQILRLAHTKKLNYIADKVFKQKSYLKFIDGYHSPVSDKDVLPWHTDQAYMGVEKRYEGFVNPDYAHLKFFIYLSNVGPNNGCMSYIPYSHKIGYALRKGIFLKKLKYEPYFTLKEFRSFIKKKVNRNYIENYWNDDSLINKFLIKTEFIERNENSEEFDYNLSPGDAIIFNEGGVHKGSKSMLNERFVLRYLYSIRKN